MADHPHSPDAAAKPEDRERSLAVALQSDGRPVANTRVVASGRGAVAEQILEIAFERGVKVRSDGDLAEILAAVEIESEIPLSALAAVAEILSYVYRSQQGGGPENRAADSAENIREQPL